MKCKFCGCTDRRACRIPMRMLAEDDLVGRPVAIALCGQLAEFAEPCHWIAPNICSSPACVERAYTERCAEIDELMAEDLVA